MQTGAREPTPARISRHQQLQPALSIVMPVYNEAAILEPTIDSLSKQLAAEQLCFELIISENGSSDATAMVARELADKQKSLHVLTAPVPDYGAAIRAGIAASSAPYVVIFDIDYYDIDFLRRALSLLQDYDIVIASKLSPEAQDRRSLARRIVTRGFSIAIRFLFRTKTSETHGMKAFRREAILPVFKATRLGKDLFDTELIIRAERNGLKIVEVPAVVEERRPARSSIARRIPRTILGLFRLRYLLWTKN